MRKKEKKWLVSALSLIVFGLAVFVAVMSFLHWDFKKLGTVEYETNTYTINENFDNISINTDTSDIIFSLSNDGSNKIVIYEPKEQKHSVNIDGATLNIESSDDTKWYYNIGINVHSPEIKLYLTKAEYDFLSIKESTGDLEIPKEFSFSKSDISLSTGDINFFANTSDMLKIKTTTGDIKISNIKAGTIDIFVTTGDAYISDVMCKNIISCGDTGDILFKNVLSEEKISTERSTGNVKFDGCDASEINVKTTTGDVVGSFISEKIFITETSTGTINVPKTTTGGKCTVTTSTGDILFADTK